MLPALRGIGDGAGSTNLTRAVQIRSGSENDNFQNQADLPNSRIANAMAAIANPNRTARSSVFIAPEPVQSFRLFIVTAFGHIGRIVEEKMFFQLAGIKGFRDPITNSAGHYCAQSLGSKDGQGTQFLGPLWVPCPSPCRRQAYV